MRFDKIELSTPEDPQSSTPAAFGVEAYNLPTGGSSAIAMCTGDTNQNRTARSTDNVGSKPDSYQHCPWIPDRHIEEFLSGSGQPGG